MVVRADLLEEATRASLIRHFTVDELNAMADSIVLLMVRVHEKIWSHMADVASCPRRGDSRLIEWNVR